MPGMQQLPGLPPDAFDKQDHSPDPAFYAQPRFVTHIDEGAIVTVTQLYRDALPAGGIILDLMSSWVSHLPEDIVYAGVIAQGMNAAELAANPRLQRWVVQDLNVDPILPFEDETFDGACLCVSIQYLQRPVEVLQEVARVLRPGAPLVVSFSNRCFPTKAVAIWQALPGPEQQRLVAAYMRASGFGSVAGHGRVPVHGDPLWAVVGRRT